MKFDSMSCKFTNKFLPMSFSIKKKFISLIILLDFFLTTLFMFVRLINTSLYERDQMCVICVLSLVGNDAKIRACFAN